MAKNLPANTGDAGDSGSIPALGRSPGGRNGNPLQYSCLGNPMDRGAWWTTVHGVRKSQTQLSKHACTHTHTHTHIGFCLPVLWFPTLVAQWNHLESFKKSWILAPLFHPPFYLFLSLFLSLYHLSVALCLLAIYLYASFIYLSTYLLSIITCHQTMVMLWTKLETGIKIGVDGGRCYVS